MVCLLRNIKQIPPPKFQMQEMPPPNDKSEGADLVRLKLHRNPMAHLNTNTIDAHTFKTMWEDIKQAVLRLGGSKYQEKCDEIKNRIFDTTTIKNCQQKLQADVSYLEQRMLNLEQQTVLDSHRVLIEQWEQDEKKLVYTNAIANIMTLIENKKCILIKGNPGSGRSFTIRHIALKLRDRMCKQEYEIVMCRESKDIETYFKAEAYQVFVFDDICGEYTIDRREANKWSTPLTRAYITNILNRGKSKLLVSVKNQVFKESLFSELNYLKFALIDMSDEKVVTLDQKFTIAKQLLSINIKANSSVINELEDCRRNRIIRNIEFAPLIFTLDYCNEIIPVTFTDPIETYYKELHALRNVEDQSKMCALFLMIVHNGNISANFFSAIETPTEQNQRQCIFEEFMIPNNISRLSIEEHLRALEGWLVVYERGAFCPKYQTIFDFLCYFFGDDTQKMQKVFIRHAHSHILTRRTTFKSLKIGEIPQFTILITSENEQICFERMVDDICLGRIWDTLSNNQLHSSLEFRKRFVKHLRDNLKDKKCDLMNSIDRSDPCIPVSTLYVAVYFGFMPIVQYLIQISSSQLRDIQDNFPPLIAACEKGTQTLSICYWTTNPI